MENGEQDYVPPPGPPPFLPLNQLTHLATQGWLILPPPSTRFQARGPGTSSVLSSLQSSIDIIFPRLPSFFSEPVDKKIKAYPRKSGTEFGYYAIEGEKEYLTLRCRGHESEIEDAAANLWRDAGQMMKRILCDIAVGLDLSPRTWEPLLEGTLQLPGNEKEMSSGTLLRLFRYEADSGFAGVHTDLGLLTLCIGSQRGLQVLDRQLLEQGGGERWVDVEAGQMCILVGQTVRALTKDRVRAGVHRVVATERERNSVVFALRHSWRSDIDLAEFGGEGVVEARKLWGALKIGVVNVNAPKELREKQQKELDDSRAGSEGRARG
jgi:hypothetical protein